jgi:hypothetical protein
MIYAIIAVGLIAAVYFLNLGNSIQTQPLLLPQQQQKQPQRLQQPATNIYVSGGGGDDRYTRAPEPLRIWNGLGGGGLGFSTTTLPFNIPTQGYPPSFSSVGIITTDDGQVLPLYGRPSSYNSDRYNYYTRTDTYNPVPLPLKFEKRDCMDDTGCQEVFSKDKVHISALGKEATAHIFKFDAPKYVPTM